MVCCQSGQYQTVQLLLDTGADPNILSPISKKTAMHWAAVNRRDLQGCGCCFNLVVIKGHERMV